ncbi:MAG: UvrD-helicase domain-containing protein [Solirubrobacteraceae bacterium]
MSAGKLIDEQARNRVATALDENLCVEAAAGTGKTTVLVNRVVNLLATGTVKVDQLVVITFTEKAAAELATRVRDRLENRANQASGDERERLLAAARDLYRAHIETIHSFATALLHERPVEAKLDPLFEVLQGLAGSLDFDAAYERFQDDLLDKQLPELQVALARGLGLAELRQACEHVNEHRYLLPLDHPPIVADDIGGTISTLREIVDELRDMLVRHQPPGDDKAIPVIEAIRDWVARLNDADPLTQERMLIAGGPKPYADTGTAGSWGGEKPRLKELRKDYEKVVSETAARLKSNALLGLLPHVETFVGTYEQARRQGGTADFDDLLFWARDLLRDDRPAREYFRRRFRAVLIDEFQDTDPVQAELALLLTSDQEPGDEWRTLAPVPGRLTVVGDPKQSIYRFRRADIAVYEGVKDGPLAGGAEQISTNFRSNAAMLKALNAIFDKVLQAQPGLQPGNVPLEDPPGAPAARRPPVVLVEGAVEGDAPDVRKAEAMALAGLLHKAHEERWEVRDRRDGEWKACRWGDMAILMPARTGLEIYEDALAGAGIPYRHEGSRDFFQRDEVRDLIWVLAAIDDPTDRIALVGALRSSAFAVSDAQLVIHAARNGALSYFSKPGASEMVNEALAELRELHNLRAKFSLAEVIRRVVERTRLVEFALTRPDGEQGAANLLAIVDDARMFAAAGGGGLRPFIRHLRDSMENEAIEIEATVAEETDDVVRIMTTHGAKGLEYPIVALANLGTRPKIDSEPVPREEESFLHFRVGTESGYGHFPTPGYKEVWEAEKAHFVAEKLRLLYVAATRARDHLLIPCVVGKLNAPHLLGELVRALPVDDEKLVRTIPLDELDVQAVEAHANHEVTDAEVDAAVLERDHWIDGSDALKDRAAEDREIETASSRERSRGPLAAEVEAFGATLLVGDGPPLPVGDAVHMVMERISFPNGDDLELVADDVCKEGAITEQTSDVVAMCRVCLQAPSVQRAAVSRRYWREVPFVLSRATDGADPDRGPLVNGRVDLVYQENDELAVVDYKTDKNVTNDNAEKHALEHHSGQAEVYAQALAAATGMPVREVVFVYCKAGTEVRLRDGEVVR